MELRRTLMPPHLDPALVDRLAILADSLDGCRPGEGEEHLREFNERAGTQLSIGDFQGISGAEEAENFVRRILYRQQLRIDDRLTVAEMTEIISQIRAADAHRDFFLEVFRIHCRNAAGTDLIYWPSLVPEFENNSSPSSEEIAILALRPQ